MLPDKPKSPVTDASADAAPAAGAPSRTPSIPGYRVVRRLGQGGMAVVYLALQESLDREVAIKVMAPQASANEGQAQRFEHEARIIAKLEHPGIVGIHEVGRTGEGQLYYVMPYLARGDLSQRDYRDNETRIVALLRNLLDALGYAHARGFVHRDVKPENVLFNNADQPQLTDFGIALSRRTGRARITTDGLALGSGGYMSPEQARGEPVDGRADIYSLGVMTYELLTGELPFHNDDALALALMHAGDPIPKLPPDKARWQDFIDKAMAKLPKQRFRSAHAMQRALDSIAKQLQMSPAIGALRAIAAWRRPAALIAAGAVFAALIGVWLIPGIYRAVIESDSDLAPDVSLSSTAPDPLSPDNAAAIDSRLAEARAQFDAGALVEPAGANAAESYLAVLRADPSHDEASAGLDAVIERLGADVVAAIDAGDPDQLRPAYEQARLMAESTQRADGREWTGQQQAVLDAVRRRATAALDRVDLEAAQAWVEAGESLGLPGADWSELRARLTPQPAAGSLIQDRGGPALSYVPAQWQGSQIDAPFAMMRTEVSRADYASFVRATSRAPARCRSRISPMQLWDKRSWSDPGFEQGGTHPVTCVSFEDARAYAAWLSRRSAARYRLPTLAEWRHAAALSAITRICAEGNVLDQSAGGASARHACSDGHAHTAPMQSFRATALGLYDLVGNVSEWTLSCAEAGNPIARLLEKDTCPRRIAAGLSWRDGTDATPGRYNSMLEPARGYDDVGFRLLRELPAAEPETR